MEPKGMVRSHLLCAWLLSVSAWGLAWAGGIDYQVKYVPDFDQKRGVGPMIPGLPNNGSCYCMPASCINWVAFLANRGYPQFGPPGNWQNPDRYNIVTAALDSLGDQMKTDQGGPDPNDPKNNLPCGTGGEEAIAALIANFNSLAPGKFVVTMHYASGNYAPKYTNLVNAMLNGSLVLLRYGHYQEVVVPIQGIPAYARDGGHIMSLTGVQGYNEPGVRLRFRNPSTDESPDDLLAQSLFKTDDSAVVNVTTVFDAFVRTQSQLTDISTNPKFIDGYIQIKPIFGLTVPDCCNDLQMNTLNPILAIHGNPPANATYASPSDTPFLEVQIHPELNRYRVLTAPGPAGGPAKLWEIDPVTGAFSPIMDIGNPQGMTFGRRGELYVRDDALLRVIDPDAAAPGGGPQIGSVPLTIPMSGKIEYHDTWDNVAGVSADHTLMVFVKWSPNSSSIHTRPMATGISLPGVPTIATDANTGRYLVKGSLGSIIYILEDNGTVMEVVDQIDLGPTIEGRTDALFIDAHGKVGITMSGAIVIYENVSGDWKPTVDHPFAGLPAGKHLRIASSRHNFDPDTMTGPEQLDVLPAEDGPSVSDCHADIAPAPLGNGAVDVEDLLLLINLWGGCTGTPETCPADIAPINVGNASVDVEDLLMLINNWGPCQ